VSVLVIGNCTVDLSFAVERFPRAGETLLARERRVDLGGKGANQALVAHRFGVDARLAAPIGRDPEGDWAFARLAGEGLDTASILRSDTATDQSILYVTPDGENTIVSSHGAAASATPAWAVETVERAPAGTSLLMQGNLTLETTRAALAAARGRGFRTLVNPAPIQYGYGSLFPLTDIAILNVVEARELGGADDPIEAATAIHAGGVPSVIVTLGARGAVLIDRGGRRSVPAPAVAAIDTVGAGDTFCGALAACLDRDIAIGTALAVAVESASLAVTRRGTQSSFPSAAEAAAILARHESRP
jgi:ribokinase